MKLKAAIRVFLMVCATLVALALIPVVWIGATVGYLGVVAPWLHARNTARAESTNAAIWQTGFADVYAMRLEAAVEDRTVSRTVDLICVRKVETEGPSLKGGPYVWDMGRRFSERDLFLPVSERLYVVYDLDLLRRIVG